MTTKQMTSGIRIASMAIDHVIMTIIVTVICMPIMLSKLSGAFEVSHYTNDTPTNYGSSFYFFLFGMSLYFCKDCLNGRSIAKRILGHQIIDKKTGLAANPLKCFVRNIFCVLWPVEIIMVFINPGSRLGDKVAGTEVVYFDREAEKQKINFAKVILSFALSYAFLFVMCLPFLSMANKMVSVTKTIDETFYNKELSELSIKKFNDSLQTYLTADIRIYNKTKTNDTIYVSAIFNLKEDYNLDDEDYDKMKKYCYHLFYLTIDKSFNGRMQFIYKHGSTLNIRDTKMEKKLSVSGNH